MKPVCHIVAGPNGSGKSTFALDFLPEFAGSIEYDNPDLMARGLEADRRQALADDLNWIEKGRAISKEGN